MRIDFIYQNIKNGDRKTEALFPMAEYCVAGNWNPACSSSAPEPVRTLTWQALITLSVRKSATVSPRMNYQIKPASNVGDEGDRPGLLQALDLEHPAHTIDIHAVFADLGPFDADLVWLVGFQSFVGGAFFCFAPYLAVVQPEDTQILGIIGCGDNQEVSLLGRRIVLYSFLLEELVGAQPGRLIRRCYRGRFCG